MDQKILDALKTINNKLGGTNDQNEKWGSLLQEIAQNVGSGGGGGGIIVIDLNEYSLPTATLGEIRVNVSSGAIIFFRIEDEYEGIRWFPIEKFQDGGTELGQIAYLQYNNSLYVSTSNDDSATWEYYD